eukprot:TRINITY_DN478_c0_g3_i1.p1 TRINITY_DN478_c0_g3~~TRINITY_DN478_c0_g3_i1.p1  ORF type:complete len:182 (+),score=52.01 TRINITY_DN478_c0_g3_i1:77-547(+)
MAPSAIPKVAIAPEKWTQTVYDTPSASLAKAEVASLPGMKFDGAYWSQAYTQCIGRGLSHKECVASIPDDTRISPQGPLAAPAAAGDMTSAVDCMTQHGDLSQCRSHFDALAAVAGYKEEEKKGTMQQASEFSSKAGYKLLGVPLLIYGMKFIKLK